MDILNKTLIILSPGFPADEADSTCLPFPQLFVKSLKQANPFLNIIVLAFQYPFSDTEYNWHGVKVIPFNGRNKGKLSRLLIWNAVWGRLKKIIRENDTLGILNFWLGECSLISKYAVKKFQVQNFTWLMGQDAKKDNRYYKLINPPAASLVALSDFIAAEFYKNYKLKPAHIIPPGIDISAYPPLPVIRYIDIIGAGSLIPLKRFDIFINVVKELVKKKPTLKALICGKGPEREQLQQRIDSAKLSRNIELYGELRHEQVLDLMQCSKVLLHPSSYEGFPTVFSEALYAGAHVVSFFTPMEHLFKNQHVVGSEDEMIRVTGALLEDANLPHERILTYPIEAACRKILSLYRN